MEKHICHMIRVVELPQIEWHQTSTEFQVVVLVEQLLQGMFRDFSVRNLLLQRPDSLNPQVRIIEKNIQCILRFTLSYDNYRHLMKKNSKIFVSVVFVIIIVLYFIHV